MGKKLDPIENAGFRQDLSLLRGTTLTARCKVRVTSVQADFRELPAHPATTSEFKQFEFSDLTGTTRVGKLDRSFSSSNWGDLRLKARIIANPDSLGGAGDAPRARRSPNSQDGCDSPLARRNGERYGTQ